MGIEPAGKKSQRTPSRIVDSVQSNADLNRSLFRFHRKTFLKPVEKLSSMTETMGRHFTFCHVSVFLTFTSFSITYTCEVKIKIENCCMQLELQNERTIWLLKGWKTFEGVEDFSVARTDFPNWPTRQIIFQSKSALIFFWGDNPLQDFFFTPLGHAIIGPLKPRAFHGRMELFNFVILS